MRWPRVILHLDCDSFFVQVHEHVCPEEMDGACTDVVDGVPVGVGVSDEEGRSRGGAGLRGRPVVVWQFRDVFCVNHLARQLGVAKHCHPKEAERILLPAGGSLVHAFYRMFPGPRVWYEPYHRASREVFRVIRRELGARDVMEKVSIDEAFVDATLSCEGLPGRAIKLAERIREACKRELGYIVSVGVAENRLLAKLSSVRAKPDGLHVLYDAEKVLHRFSPTKLAGLGFRKEQLQRWACIADLREESVEGLSKKLEISEELALKTFYACRGVDEKPVCPSQLPKSISLTSWVASGTLSELLSPSHLGYGQQPGVKIGGFVFEPHPRSEKFHSSGRTRIRWVLLALAMDLDERIISFDAEFNIRPAKLNLQFHVPGDQPRVGSLVRVGKISSKSRPFPSQSYWRRLSPGKSADFVRPVDAVESFQDPTYAERIGTLLATAAEIVQEMCERDGKGCHRVAQIGLAVSSFYAMGGGGGGGRSPARSAPPLNGQNNTHILQASTTLKRKRQRTIEDFFFTKGTQKQNPKP